MSARDTVKPISVPSTGVFSIYRNDGIADSPKPDIIYADNLNPCLRDFRVCLFISHRKFDITRLSKGLTWMARYTEPTCLQTAFPFSLSGYIFEPHNPSYLLNMGASVLNPTPMIPHQMTGPLSWYLGSTAVQMLVHHVFDKYLRSLQGGWRCRVLGRRIIRYIRRDCLNFPVNSYLPGNKKAWNLRFADCVSKMGFTDMLSRCTLAEYSRKIRAAPREVIFSRSLLLSAMMYATTAIPLSESFLASCAGLSQPTSIDTIVHSMGSRICGHSLLSIRFPTTFRHQLRIGGELDQKLCLACIHWQCSRCGLILPHQWPYRTSVVLPAVHLHMDNWAIGGHV